MNEEFFDRKRLGAIKSVSNKTSRKKGVSQDLLALHTVSRAHSKDKQDEDGRKSIKRVDLDRFQSCTKRIEEVDMGPSSPTPTQSRLLMESKSNMNNSTTETAKFTPHRGSETAFLKPESLSVHDGRFGKSDKDHASKDPHTHSNRKHRHSAGTDELQKPRQNSGTDQWMKNELREHVSSYSDESRSRYDQSFRFSKHEKKPQSNYDPFASEDFQITPLRKYSKNDSPVTQTHDNSRKRGCSQSLQEWSMCGTGESNPKHAKTSHSDTYCTSTPVENLDKFNPPAKSKDKFNFSVFEDSFSPIPKLLRHIPEVEDDFQYQPRPMINTPEAFKARCITPVLSNASVASHTVNHIKMPENPSKYLTFSCEKDSSQYEPETILSSSKVKEHGFYETSSKDSYLESVKRSNVFLQCSSEDPVGQLFNVRDSPQVTPKQRNETVHSGSNSSLLQYRQKFLQYKTELISSDQQSEETERLSMTSTQLHVNTSEPEIWYKPFKKQTSDKERKIDIMRLYQEHKGTDDRGGSLQQNCTVTSQPMLTSHQLEETEHQLEQTDTKVRRLSGGEAENYASSPKIGEDYPAHLNYQSVASGNAEQISKQEVTRNHSQETEEWHTPNVNMADTRRKQTGGDSTSVADSHMEEVLQEMKELEQQDSVVQDESSENSCNNLNQMAACHVEPSTEISETDRFLDSERKFWNLQGIDDMVLQGSVDKMGFVGSEITDLNVDTAMVGDKMIPLSQTASETKFTDSMFEGMKKQTDLKEFGNSKSVGTEKTDMVKSDGTAESKEHFQQQNKTDILNEPITELPVNGEIITDDNIKVQSVSCSHKEKYVHENQLDETKSPLSFVQQAVVTVKLDDKDSNLVSDSVNTARPIKEEPDREKNDDTCNEHIEININLLTEESNKPGQSEVKYAHVKDKVALGIAAVHQVTRFQSVATADFKEMGLKPLDMGTRTDPCIEESKTFITPEHITSCDSVLDSCDSVLDSNVESECINVKAVKNSKYFINLKSETPQTAVSSLQDPQVSSGCNQGVQTDRVQSIDMASSPFVGCHSPTATKSVGIQCNFESGEKMPAKNATTTIPMLGSLASNLIGSSYRRGISFVSFFNKNLGSSSSDMMTSHGKLGNGNSQKELSISVLDSDAKSHQTDGENSAAPEVTTDIGKKEN